MGSGVIYIIPQKNDWHDFSSTRGRGMSFWQRHFDLMDGEV